MERIQYTLILFLLLMPAAFARVDLFNTQINVSWANNVCTVQTEDHQVRTYSSAVTNDRMTINLYRNTSCREEQLYNFMQTVFVRENQTQKITRQYNNCSIQLGQLQADYKDDVYLSENVTYRNRYESCNSQLGTCQANANTAATCQTQLTQAQSDKQTWGIGGAALGALIIYFMFVKKPLAEGPTSRLPPAR